MFNTSGYKNKMALSAWSRSTPTDKKTYPIQVSFFGFQAILQVSEALTYLIEQASMQTIRIRIELMRLLKEK